MSDLGSVAYMSDGRWDDEPEPANQYLAWGGESEGYSIVTAAQIRKDIEQGHYSGYRSWTGFALIGRALGDGLRPALLPVSVVSHTERYTDANDYVYQGYSLVDDEDNEIESFETRIDGRA